MKGGFGLMNKKIPWWVKIRLLFMREMKRIYIEGDKYYIMHFKFWHGSMYIIKFEEKSMPGIRK